MTIIADYGTLMRQAPATVGMYLDAAIEILDAKFGAGYAREHPELVAAFLAASTAVQVIAVQEMTDRIVDVLDRVVEELRDVSSSALLSGS